VSNHSIGGADTCWVFISDSDEVRHLYDVVHGVAVLHARGVDDQAIRIFTNHSQASLYISPYGCPSPIAISDFSQQLAGLAGFRYVVIVATGHGRPDGIGSARTTIKPHDLVAAARVVPGIELAVIILSQCFAGVFNYIDATASPAIVMLGATNLGLSISPQISLGVPVIGSNNGAPVQLGNWNANAFMFYFFRWILNPSDVDGDGQISLIDAYKFAGASSTDEISKIKSQLFMRSQEISIELSQYKAKISAGGLSVTEKLTVDSLRSELSNYIAVLYVSQEPWLLHANLARKISLI